MGDRKRAADTGHERELAEEDFSWGRVKMC
jgi:hypothetical protein